MKTFEAYAERGSDTDPYTPFTDPPARIRLQGGRSALFGSNSAISPLAGGRVKLLPRFTWGGLLSLKTFSHSRWEHSQGLSEMLQKMGEKLGVALVEADPYAEMSQYLQSLTTESFEKRVEIVLEKLAERSQSQHATQPKTVLDEFLRPVIQLEKGGHTDAALDALYDRVDHLLRTKQFAKIDALLQQAEVDSISVDILLGLLTASIPARSKLPARAKFYAEVEASIKRRGEWEDGLLAGLES